ncbi:polcalcin Phl p 7-like [Gossypium australe]|uniref:Polcalcin Phl p 7-like n=1 Tax=Gossypium australe TaxID=47621 RepID=A0A5B6W503_9ROSI|nr:polcalcin Phl p 7-like [Gossypium australe]
MAIKTYKSISMDGKLIMTMDEFKQWLKKFDADNDGRISKEELRNAIYETGGRFTRWKSRRAIKSADADGSGFIDENEITNLVDFADKYLGVRCATKGFSGLRLSEMAIKTRAYSVVDGKREMTIDEFKRWLKKFDDDKDGRISRDELADAIRVSRGGWFTRRKSKCIIRSVDANRNGFIDDNEIKNLAEFAEKYLNVKILYL